MKASSLLQKMPGSLKVALIIIILAKLLIFGVGYVAYESNPEQPRPSTYMIITHQFARPLAPQDGPHYFDIAKNWYIGNASLDASNFIVFFPLYPILIRTVALDLSYNSLSAAALAVSNFSSLIALFYLYKLAKLEFDKTAAIKAVLFLSVFPTAYFLCAPYTEGLFFALVIASLFYAQKSNWPLAGFLSFLAALTRLGGALMFPVLLVEYLHQTGWKPRKADLRILWTLLAPAGFLLYLNINNHIWGTPFKFMEIQREHWYNTLDPITGLTRSIGWATNSSFPENLILGIAPITFALFGVVMLAFGYRRKLRPSHLSYMLLMWMLAVSTSMWISVPRYVMAIFPMFIILGSLTKKKIVNLAIVILSASALCYFTFLFSLGYFVF